MSVSFARGSAAAVMLVFSSQSAFADLTAADVWADWKAYMASTGYEVTATESQSGSTLTVSGLSMQFPIPEGEGSASVSMADLTFKENGDGTVSVSWPRESPLNIMVQNEEMPDTLRIEVMLSHDGSPMLVSGDPQEMAYDYATSEAALRLGTIMMGDEELPGDVANAEMTITGLTSKSAMRVSGGRSYDQNMTASEITFQADFKDPDSGDQGSFKGAMQGVSYDGTSSMPENLDMTDVAALFSSGLAGSANISYDSGSSSMSGQDGSDSFGFESTSQGGKFTFALEDGRLVYDLLHRMPAFTVTSSDLPFPLSLSMAEAGFKLGLPLAKSEAEQDFALGITLRDFAVPEMLWGMVDPTGALPHDPASIVLDVAGKAKVLMNFFDEAEIEAVEMGDQMPGELNALTIRELLVSAAGAKLTGTGDFTFNNEDLASFDGMPAPSGAAILTLSGANGLIDKLIEMGLMSDQDAMGARMMMGMFGVPGEGEDTLNSEIKFTEEGQILANGQRIK